MQFFYGAKTQHENLGDLVINRLLLERIREKGEVHILVNGVPGWYLDSVVCESDNIYESSVLFVKKLLLSSVFGSNGSRKVVLVLNPGGFSGDYNLYGLVRQVMLLGFYTVLKVTGVEIIRLGASFERIGSRRALVERLKSKVMKFVGLRDSLSISISKNLKWSNCAEFPDFAFLLRKSDSDRSIGSGENSRYGVAGFYSRKNSSQDEFIEKQLAKVCAHLNEHGADELLVTSQVIFDESVNDSLVERLSETCVCRSVVCRSEKSALNIYGGSAWVLSNRLHVLLFALSQGVLAFALVSHEHDIKIIGIFRDMQLPELIIPLDCEDINERIKNACAMRSELLKKINKCFNANRELIGLTLDRLFDA